MFLLVLVYTSQYLFYLFDLYLFAFFTDTNPTRQSANLRKPRNCYYAKGPASLAFYLLYRAFNSYDSHQRLLFSEILLRSSYLCQSKLCYNTDCSIALHQYACLGFRTQLLIQLLQRYRVYKYMTFM